MEGGFHLSLLQFLSLVQHGLGFGKSSYILLTVLLFQQTESVINSYVLIFGFGFCFAALAQLGYDFNFLGSIDIYHGTGKE